MRRRHSALHTYTLAEHALERRHRRRARLRERLREERLEALRQKVSTPGTSALLPCVSLLYAAAA